MLTKADPVTDIMEKIETVRKKDLSVLRKIIKNTVPGIKESMKYGMPTYELNDKAILAFSSQKNYISFNAGINAVKKNKESIKGLSWGKNCIRFTSIDKLHESEIIQIIKDSDEVC